VNNKRKNKIARLKAFLRIRRRKTNGRNIEMIPLSAAPAFGKDGKRPLGLLAGRASVEFADDFKMTEEEFFHK